MIAITSATCRAARALLDWTQLDLAEAAGVGASTVKTFEMGRTAPVSATLRAMQVAPEAAGIEFIPPNGGSVGVRLRENQA